MTTIIIIAILKITIIIIAILKITIIMIAANSDITVKKLRCLRCGFEWYPRVDYPPKSCPDCKSRRWNIPAKEKIKPDTRVPSEIRVNPQNQPNAPNQNASTLGNMIRSGHLQNLQQQVPSENQPSKPWRANGISKTEMGEGLYAREPKEPLHVMDVNAKSHIPNIPGVQRGAGLFKEAVDTTAPTELQSAQEKMVTEIKEDALTPQPEEEDVPFMEEDDSETINQRLDTSAFNDGEAGGTESQVRGGRRKK